MSTTSSNALSGLKANAFAIEIVSGNLANLNTYGYKESRVSFQDLVNSSLGTGAGESGANAVGGSTVAKAVRSFAQGSIQSTNQSFDAAIQGNGFFVLRSKGDQLYTRAGNFKVDSAGHLLTQQGQFVQGWNIKNGAVATNTGVSDITVPISGLRQPTPTTKFSISANLNSSGTVGNADGTFSSPVQMVDSQGVSHVLTVTYTKTGVGQWDYAVSMPSADLKTPVGTGPASVLKKGSLTFDGLGHLLTPAAAPGTVDVPITGLVDGASDLTVSWGLYNETGNPTLTQYSQGSANLGSTQDGTPSGQLTSMQIGPNGQIFAHYSNGDAVAVAQLAIASVLNPDSMQDRGDNTFGVTSFSSIPAIGAPATGSRGDVTGGALETSTVDIAKEFTNLLTYERGYQANSKVVTAEDDLTQQTINLKR